MPQPLAVLGAELDTVVRTLWGECRGESVLGQHGVAWVIRNRVEWPGGPYWWGKDCLAVCLKPKQFSCWNAEAPGLAAMKALATDDPMYLALRAVALAVLTGEADDPTGHASHYERIGTGARWGEGRTPSAVIGNHEFFAIGPAG